MKKVWIPNKDTVWELVDVLSVGTEANEADRTLTVNAPLPAEAGGAGRLRAAEVIAKSLTMPHDPSQSVEASQLNDLYSMEQLHEAALLDGLHRRYKKDLIYTNIGNSVLVSINPCKQVPELYTSVEPYLSSNIVAADGNNERTPHVFTIADQALNQLAQSQRHSNKHHLHNQSILVSGESGAGKTEASKYILQYLVEADRLAQVAIDQKKSLNSAFAALTTNPKRVGKNSMAALLPSSTTVFEAFSHAKTLHNNNSSRFGKYMRLQYSAENRLISAYTECFLLEKSRLISIGTNERNFHVFYALLNTANGLNGAAPNAQLKADLHLAPPEQFRILCDNNNHVTPFSSTTTTTTTTNTNTSHTGEYTLDTIAAALTAVGVSSEELSEIWSVLAVVLHMGNIQCQSIVTDGPQVDENYQQVELISPSISLSELTFLLGVSSLTFEARVLTQRVQVGNRESIHIKQLNAHDVSHNLHALIKFLYSSLTSYLLKKVNYALCHTPVAGTATTPTVVTRFIGLLDVFGFEILETNSFEQLCINYTNECMQKLFYQQLFEREQALYTAEGLTWSPIEYISNQPVIDLISKKPTGLLYITEEMCLLNRGQRDEDALLAAFNTTHGGNGGASTSTPANAGTTTTSNSGSANVNSVYERPRFGTKNLFLVHHFAGSVTYSVTSWLDKNNDALQEDLLSLLMCSNNSFIQNAIVAVGMRTGDGEFNVTSGAEGQLGFVKEVSDDRLVAGAVDGHSSRTGAGSTGDEMTEEDSTAATAAYVNNAVAMRKARTASRRASLTVGTGAGAGAMAGAGVESPAPIKKLASTMTVSYQFRNQLEVLLLSLQGTQPQYVMCFKPNADKQSDKLDRRCVLGQLKYSGAMQVAQIRQLGYPVSFPYQEFVDTYKSLLKGGNNNNNGSNNSKTSAVTKSARELTLQLLTQLHLPSVSYQAGKSLIFLRTSAFKTLQTALGNVSVTRLIAVQALARGHLAKKKYARKMWLLVKLQAKMRMFSKRRRYQRELLPVVQAKLEHHKVVVLQNQDLAAYEARVLALHAAAAKGDLTRVRDMLSKHPEDYYVANWLKLNCSVLQSAVLSGNLQLVQYLKPRPDELFYPDSDGSIAVHYAARCAATDKTEVLRYMSFICEAAYLKEIDNVPVVKGTAQPNLVRPCHGVIQDPVLPRHLDPNHNGVGSGVGGIVCVKSSLNPMTVKSVDADSRQALPGVSPGSVLKAGWLSKRGTKTQSIWRKRWAILTTDNLSYYHSEKDTVPRDTLPLRHKDCISVKESEARAWAFDITMAEGTGTGAKQREMITMLAESERDMHDWINLLTAVAGTDATPLRLSSVRTITPILSDNMFSAKNALYETPLHFLCASGEHNASNSNIVESEKTLPATAAWLIHRSCPANLSNLKGKSPLYLALEHNRYHLALLLLRYGATIPPHSAEKDTFLRFVGDDNNPDKVISALQFLPRPVRLRNFHYLSIEILQQYVGNPSLFLDIDDPAAYFLTVSTFSAQHHAMGAVQYSQCPLLRIMAKPASSGGMVAQPSRTGSDSQLILWYNQCHLQLPLESFEEGSYLVVELNRANTAGVSRDSTASAAPAGQRPSTSRHSSASTANSNSNAGTVSNIAWFTLKIDKNVLNTSVLTIPFLKTPHIRAPVAHTITTADAHAGNMHSVAMVETTIYRRNGKAEW